jgi:hypothetical protein
MGKICKEKYAVIQNPDEDELIRFTHFRSAKKGGTSYQAIGGGSDMPNQRL